MQIFFFIYLISYIKCLNNAPFPIVYTPVIDLNSQQIYKTATIENGDGKDEFFGYVVSKSLCDVNGDKINDLIAFSKNTQSITKYVYIFFGGYFNDRTKISASEINGTNGFRISYTDDSDVDDATFVDCLGDLDHDGTDEIGIGASFQNSQYFLKNKGVMYVIYGTRKIHNPILIDCDSLTPENGFQITDEGDDAKCQSSIGFQFTRLGDINGDYFDDFAINCEPNKVILIAGRMAFLGKYNISSMNDVRILSYYYKQFGKKINGNLDFNGDGLYDIMIFAADYQGYSYVLVFFGSDDIFYEGELKYQEIKGADNSTKFSLEFSTIKDFNYDNIDDILISDPQFNKDAGKLYIVYGSLSPIDIYLKTLTSNQGFSISPKSPKMCLSKISYLGNILGDSQISVGIGMGSCKTITQSTYYIIHRGDESEIFPNDLSKINGVNGISLTLNSMNLLGMSSGPLGNFMGNGTQSIAISTPGKTVQNIPNSGQIMIIQKTEFCKPNGESFEQKYPKIDKECPNTTNLNSSCEKCGSASLSSEKIIGITFAATCVGTLFIAIAIMLF